MNIQKFTQKSVEAINDCEKLAYEYGNQEIEQEHLLLHPNIQHLRAMSVYPMEVLLILMEQLHLVL